MTGYQEVVTDPSFAEQLVCFTAPMVGNYGVDRRRGRSRARRTRARSLMREARGPAWTDWLHERGVVALTGVDTRWLVLKLRDARRDAAVAVSGPTSVEEAVATARDAAAMAGRALVAGVSTKEPYMYTDEGACARRGRRLRRQALGPAAARRRGRGGHGLSARRRRRRARRLRRRAALARPRRSRAARSSEIAIVRELLGRTTVLGICLGHQLLAMRDRA